MLKIIINSFSYKNGIPLANHEHGQGFVFDCRGIENPGLLPNLAPQTGKDNDVQNFLIDKTAMPSFLENIENILQITIDKYLERGFEYLNINFGCTGGRHRSVYACEYISKRLSQKYDKQIEVYPIHTNL